MQLPGTSCHCILLMPLSLQVAVRETETNMTATKQPKTTRQIFSRIACTAACLLLSGFPGFAKTLNVILLANASTQDVIQNLFKEYSRDHPGIDFNVSIIQYSALTAKINTLLAAGEPPDILEVTTSYIQTFGEQALDLAQYSDGAALLNRYLRLTRRSSSRTPK